MSRTILLAQEFGTNLGHVSRLIAVARALGGDGRFVFAVPHADVVGDTIRQGLGPDVEIIGGLRFRSPPDRRPEAKADRTLADAFFRLGYADRDALRRASTLWRSLLDRVQPDLILSDFTPTIRLCSWDRIPNVVVGDAFATPPAGRRIPAFHPANVPVTVTGRQREDRLLATAQTVRAEFGGPPLHRFGDLFQGERVFPITIAGCDPYERLRTSPTISPFTVPDIPCGPPIAQRNGPHVFCFVWSDHPSINQIVTALNGIQRPVEVHIRGIDPQLLVSQCAPHVRIRVDTPDFATLLPQTRLFLHYGGAGATYSALLAGTMQMILPIFLEQDATTAAMIAAGVGVGLKLSPSADVDALRGHVLRQLDNQAMQAAALAASAHHRLIRKPSALPEIVAACRALLARPAS